MTPLDGIRLAVQHESRQGLFRVMINTRKPLMKGASDAATFLPGTIPWPGEGPEVPERARNVQARRW